MKETCSDCGGEVRISVGDDQTVVTCVRMRTIRGTLRSTGCGAEVHYYGKPPLAERIMEEEA